MPFAFFCGSYKQNTENTPLVATMPVACNHYLS